jgi:hypothetical protein
VTERQKKKLVVRRLEQLFTGKVNGIVGDHNQPLQQQVVSKSAARADQTSSNTFASIEGVREAHIWPQPKDVDKSTPSDLLNERSNDSSISRDLSGAAVDNNSGPASPEQRPTRPLDLDPDRAQIPSDNVEYLCHLGLSTPQLITEDSSDAESDAQGWIYLNLLISLAQLHIINVTPDFVRSAVEDVSSKFQLSRDGRKIRWRGGAEGSRFSSDSDTSSARIHSHDSDSLEESNRKRRKLDEPNTRRSSQGRFASAPIQTQDPASLTAASAPANPFHYKPLFNHQNSEDGSMSFDRDGSNMSYTLGGGSGTGRISRPTRLWGQRSRSGSSGRQRRQDGPIVFYSGAKFFTDLSGDRGSISTPRHVTGVGKDGYSDHTFDALGCSYRKSAGALLRTPSGSLMQFRPFKDFSGQTVDQFKEEPLNKNESVDIEPGLRWSSRESSPVKPMMAFNASGLGGTQPADHFAVTVETRRTKLDGAMRTKLSRTGLHIRKFQHSIPRASLNIFRNSEQEDITSKLPPSQVLPVKTEVVSTRFHKLEPSELPAPTAYYAESSSSYDDSEYSSS